MYKIPMTPLCVFLCEDQFTYDQAVKLSDKADYHRFFILADNKIIRNRIIEKNSDNFMIFKYNKNDMTLIARLVVCYSDPVYSHIFINLKNNFNLDSQKVNFIKKDFFQNDSCLGFTRQWVALNGFTFDYTPKDNQIDPLEFSQEMSKAFNEIPVNQKFFLEALIELLPQCHYDMESLSNFDNEIISLIKNKSIQSSVAYKVFYEPNHTAQKNDVIFSYKDFDSYKFLIKRTDGLKCFIF